MNVDDPHSRPALQALCRQAGEEAASGRFGAAAAPRTAPPSRRAGWMPRLGLVLVLVLVLGACAVTALAAVAWAAWLPPPAPTAAATSAAVPLATSVAPPHQAPAATPAAQPVRWQGTLLAVDLDDVPLPQAVALLAGATRTTVSGAELLRADVPVRVHAVFGHADLAWQHLLQQHAGYSISCAAGACRLWITRALAANTPGAAAAAAVRPDAAAKQPPTPADADAAELERSQPDGSC